MPALNLTAPALILMTVAMLLYASITFCALRRSTPFSLTVLSGVPLLLGPLGLALSRPTLEAQALTLLVFQPVVLMAVSAGLFARTLMALRRDNPNTEDSPAATAPHPPGLPLPKLLLMLGVMDVAAALLGLLIPLSGWPGAAALICTVAAALHLGIARRLGATGISVPLLLTSLGMMIWYLSSLVSTQMGLQPLLVPSPLPLTQWPPVLAPFMIVLVGLGASTAQPHPAGPVKPTVRTMLVKVGVQAATTGVLIACIALLLPVPETTTTVMLALSAVMGGLILGHVGQRLPHTGPDLPQTPSAQVQ